MRANAEPRGRGPYCSAGKDPREASDAPERISARADPLCHGAEAVFLEASSLDSIPSLSARQRFQSKASRRGQLQIIGSCHDCWPPQLPDVGRGLPGGFEELYLFGEPFGGSERIVECSDDGLPSARDLDGGILCDPDSFLQGSCQDQGVAADLEE
jgi:hypothetical protein